MKVQKRTVILSFSIAAYIIAHRKKEAKVIIIHRCGDHLYHNWQMVSGKLDIGENA